MSQSTEYDINQKIEGLRGKLLHLKGRDPNHQSIQQEINLLETQLLIQQASRSNATETISIKELPYTQGYSLNNQQGTLKHLVTKLENGHIIAIPLVNGVTPAKIKSSIELCNKEGYDPLKAPLMFNKDGDAIATSVITILGKSNYFLSIRAGSMEEICEQLSGGWNMSIPKTENKLKARIKIDKNGQFYFDKVMKKDGTIIPLSKLTPQEKSALDELLEKGIKTDIELFDREKNITKDPRSSENKSVAPHAPIGGGAPPIPPLGGMPPLGGGVPPLGGGGPQLGNGGIPLRRRGDPHYDHPGANFAEADRPHYDEQGNLGDQAFYEGPRANLGEDKPYYEEPRTEPEESKYDDPVNNGRRRSGAGTRRRRSRSEDDYEDPQYQGDHYTHTSGEDNIEPLPVDGRDNLLDSPEVSDADSTPEDSILQEGDRSSRSATPRAMTPRGDVDRLEPYYESDSDAEPYNPSTSRSVSPVASDTYDAPELVIEDLPSRPVTPRTPEKPYHQVNKRPSPDLSGDDSSADYGSDDDEDQAIEEIGITPQNKELFQKFIDLIKSSNDVTRGVAGEQNVPKAVKVAQNISEALTNFAAILEHDRPGDNTAEITVAARNIMTLTEKELSQIDIEARGKKPDAAGDREEKDDSPGGDSVLLKLLKIEADYLHRIASCYLKDCKAAHPPSEEDLEILKKSEMEGLSALFAEHVALEGGRLKVGEFDAVPVGVQTLIKEATKLPRAVKLKFSDNDLALSSPELAELDQYKKIEHDLSPVLHGGLLRAMDTILDAVLENERAPEKTTDLAETKLLKAEIEKYQDLLRANQEKKDEKASLRSADSDHGSDFPERSDDGSVSDSNPLVRQDLANRGSGSKVNAGAMTHIDVKGERKKQPWWEDGEERPQNRGLHDSKKPIVSDSASDSDVADLNSSSFSLKDLESDEQSPDSSKKKKSPRLKAPDVWRGNDPQPATSRLPTKKKVRSEGSDKEEALFKRVKQPFKRSSSEPVLKKPGKSKKLLRSESSPALTPLSSSSSNPDDDLEPRLRPSCPRKKISAENQLEEQEVSIMKSRLSPKNKELLAKFSELMAASIEIQERTARSRGGKASPTLGVIEAIKKAHKHLFTDVINNPNNEEAVSKIQSVPQEIFVVDLKEIKEEGDPLYELLEKEQKLLSQIASFLNNEDPSAAGPTEKDLKEFREFVLQNMATLFADDVNRRALPIISDDQHGTMAGTLIDESKKLPTVVELKISSVKTLEESELPVFIDLRKEQLSPALKDALPKDILEIMEKILEDILETEEIGSTDKQQTQLLIRSVKDFQSLFQAKEAGRKKGAIHYSDNDGADEKEDTVAVDDQPKVTIDHVDGHCQFNVIGRVTEKTILPFISIKITEANDSVNIESEEDYLTKDEVFARKVMSGEKFIYLQFKHSKKDLLCDLDGEPFLVDEIVVCEESGTSYIKTQADYISAGIDQYTDPILNESFFQMIPQGSIGPEESEAYKAFNKKKHKAIKHSFNSITPRPSPSYEQSAKLGKETASEIHV